MYGSLAAAAVAQVQSQLGPSNGDKQSQQTKLQMAVALVLAAAHAGESVPSRTVQTIAAIVEFNVSLAKALGLFGKTSTGDMTVTVPTSDPAAK